MTTQLQFIIIIIIIVIIIIIIIIIIYMPTVLQSGSLSLLEPSGPVQASNGIALPLPSRYMSIPSTEGG